MSTAEPIHPHINRILSGLPRDEYERISPRFENISLPLGQVLYQPEERIAYVYFPLLGTISITAVMEDGSEVEVGVIGREGMLGLPLVLGTDSAPLKAVVQVPGSAMRLRAGAFGEELKRCETLGRLLLGYAQAFFVQTAITAGCNRLHPLDGRLARWLLTTRDRAQSDTLPLTQEFLGVMLGVRRAGVTEACGALSAGGLIEHTRGRIRIADPQGLERASCECYAVVRKEYDRLLGAETHYE
ncbi:MAG: Crp/Fnr family transcriptional regulator [Acidobacteria bacterium]|nr:MAG: Crp/Fnr family transcriptional regulator [Acidobacteriota bacterium]PYS85034.1 MAG: Crp/Fnr family transcriptional regulator [Acidobacteriota bacterium]